MELIYHRRNSIEDLTSSDAKYGIEVDIRSNGNDLIIHHDPFALGYYLESGLSATSMEP